MSELTEQLREKLGGTPPGGGVEPTAQTHNENTFFLMLSDSYEQGIARAYVKAKYPKTKAKLAAFLPLPRLTGDMIVIPLFRGSDRSPAAATLLDTHGRPFIDRKAAIALAHEVREGSPIHIGRFFHKTAAFGDAFGDAFGGTLDRNAFLDALNAVCTPCVCYAEVGKPDDAIMRL